MKTKSYQLRLVNSRKTTKSLLDLKKERNKPPRLKYFRYIAGLEEELPMFGYEERDAVGFRIVDNPANEMNFVPQVFKPNRATPPCFKESEVLRGMNEEQRRKRVDESGLSFFDTHEAAQQAARRRDQRFRAKKRSNEERLRLREELGLYVVKVQICKSDGVATQPDEEGHFNVLPYEDVAWTAKIDNVFGYSPISYEEDEQI